MLTEQKRNRFCSVRNEPNIREYRKGMLYRVLEGNICANQMDGKAKRSNSNVLHIAVVMPNELRR